VLPYHPAAAPRETAALLSIGALLEVSA
jgi:hypothetical protein